MRYTKAKLRFLSLMLSAVLCIGSTAYAFADEKGNYSENILSDESLTDAEEESVFLFDQEDREESSVSENETDSTVSEDEDASLEEASEYEEEIIPQDEAVFEEDEQDAAEEKAAEEGADIDTADTGEENEEDSLKTEDPYADVKDNDKADEVSDPDESLSEIPDEEEENENEALSESDGTEIKEENASEEDDKQSGSEDVPAADAEADKEGSEADGTVSEGSGTEQTEKAQDSSTSPDETKTKTEETEEAAEAGDAEVSGNLRTATYKLTGKYVVAVRNFSAPKDVKGLKAVLWPEKSPSDDPKVLYLSASDTDASVWSATSLIKDFSCYGNINVEIYLIRSKGKEELFKSGSFRITPPKAEEVKAVINKKTGDIKISVSGVTSEFAVGKVEAKVVNMTDASNTVTYRAAESEGQYTATGNISDLKSRTGRYKVSVVVTPKNGIRKFVGSVKFSYRESVGAIKYKDKNKGKTGKEQRYYYLSLSGTVVDYGIRKAEFTVWNKNYPDKKINYAAEKTSRGIYTVIVPIKDFKTKGTYTAEAYITDGQGNRKMITSSDIWTIDGEASGSIRVTKTYDLNGSFRVLLKASAPAGISSVKFAVWVKADKSDLVYYTGKKTSDGNFAAIIKAVNHGQYLGTYKIKAIVKMYNWTKSRLIGKKYYFVPTNYTYCETPELGKRTIYLSNPSISNAQFYVWSDSNGQDDMVVYEAVKKGQKWTVDIPLSNHSGSGVYNVHIYTGTTYLTGLSFDVVPNEAKTGWYYENGYKFYYNMGEKLNDVRSLVSGPYEIWINRQMNTITIYAMDGANGFIIPVVAFVCSCGLPGMETPTGWYTAGYQSRWEELMGPSWGQYTTHVVDGIYIHSVAGYNMTPYNLDPYDYNNLGNFASHGCIRVNVASAKWIYDNCPPGTWINIYDSDWPGPLGKPESIKIPPYQNWDPTDPNI